MTASHSSSVMLAMHAVAQDAGVVDQHVEVAERVDRRLDQALGALEVGDALAVGDGLAAGGDDLVDDLLRRRGVGAAAVHVAAEVVDHDLGPVAGQRQGVLPPDPRPAPVTMATRPSHSLVMRRTVFGQFDVVPAHPSVW